MSEESAEDEPNAGFDVTSRSYRENTRKEGSSVKT